MYGEIRRSFFIPYNGVDKALVILAEDRPRAGERHPSSSLTPWIPASAGMTN